MAGSVGKPVGVKRFAGGARVMLKPEAGRQVCPICGLMTYRARTLDEPGQWFRFDDTALYVEHRCRGMLRATPPAGMVATRRVVGSADRSRLGDALGPIVAAPPRSTASPGSPVPVETPRSQVDDRTDTTAAETTSVTVANAGVVPASPERIPLWRSGAAIAPSALASVPTLASPIPPAVPVPLAAKEPGEVARDGSAKVWNDPGLDRGDGRSRQLGAALDEAFDRRIRFVNDSSGTVSTPATLQARIDAAAPGDTIDVEPGTYDESLILRHLLTFRATGDGVILAPANGPAIALLGCGLTLENITLRPAVGDGIVVRPAELSRPDARPIVTLTDCRIEAPNRAVFAMIDAVTVRVFGSSIVSETGSGLMMQSDSVVRAEQTTISTRGGRGVMTNDRAILQLSGTSIERCGGDGIRIGQGSIVWMDREEPVEIRGNAGHGLAMGPRSMATLRGTVITANRGWGIQAPEGQLTVLQSVNAINWYGALDPAGNPVLIGSWVATPQIPLTVENADLNDSNPDLPVLPEPIEPAAMESIPSDVDPDVSVVVVTLPEPEGSSGLVLDPDETSIVSMGYEPAIPAPTPAPDPSRARADDLLLRLIMIDGIETVRLKDPRFRWLVRQLPPSAGLATLLVDALESVVTVPIVSERTIDLLDQLLDYVGWLAGLTLEEELQSIVAPLTTVTMAPAILARLGWEGPAPVTLQAASAIANVTRERIRQVQNRLEQVLNEGTVWAPVLDRVLTTLVALAPVRPDQAADHLHGLGLTTEPVASVEGILEAQRVLGRTSKLRLVERSGFALLTTSDDGADAILGEFEEIRVAAQKRVNNQGIATLGEIREHLAGQGRDIPTAAIAEVIGLGNDYRVVGGDHVVPAAWDTRNPLWNRLAKMLCLAPGLSVEMAAWQLGRDERRSYPATPSTLRIFVEAHPELELRDDCMISTVEIGEGSVLSDSERTLVGLFRDHGPERSFTELVPLAVGPNFTRVTLALRLASSPLIVKLARNRYRLLTAQDRPGDDLALVDDDLSGTLVDSLPEANPDAAGLTGRRFDGSPDEDAEDVASVPATEPEPEPEPESDSAPDPVRVTGAGLPRLVMAPGTEISVRLPDAGVAPVHQVVADLFAGRLRWPAEPRRQRWSATRLPDLLEAIYHGLALGPLVVQRQAVAEPERSAAAEPGVIAGSGARADVTAMVIVDGQQRLAWLARLFNAHYRIPGQPQLAPVRVAFQPDIAGFSLAGSDSAIDPFLIADIGPLVRGEASPWRITGDYIARLRMVRSVDEVTADRLATAIAAVAALRDAHLTIQPVSDRLHPDAIAHLYDRLHRS